MKKVVLLIMFCVLLPVFIVGCGKQMFSGNRTGNDDQFILDYSILNKTETHQMKLEKGTIINVAVENKSGRVDILIAGDDGTEIYRGDNASSGKFSVDVPKTGTYTFSVKGTKAKGSVSFKAASKTLNG